MTPTLTLTTHLPQQCDRCTAPGKLRAFLPTGGDLTFCAHHATHHHHTIHTNAHHIVIETGFGWRAP